MIQLAQILFILSVLVILHEFGHYITAKWFKVRVEKFYLFMDAGFSLVKKKIGETEWGIGWLPLGGYVKLSGMIDESMDTEQMKQEAQPWEFRSKPAWQRLIIMLGGIIVNILLAWFIYTAMYTTVGKKYVSTEIIQKEGLAFGDVGQKAGFQNGDKIVSVDGKFQENFNRMVMDILFSEEIVVDRNGEQVKLNLTDEQIGEILEKEGRSFVLPRIDVNKIFIDSVGKNSFGIKRFDEIIGFNDSKFEYLDEIKTMFQNHLNDSVRLVVRRNGIEENINVLIDSTGVKGLSLKKNVFLNISSSIKNIDNITKDSNLYKDGLKYSDEILAFNDNKFTNDKELKEYIATLKPNSKIKVLVERSGVETTINSTTDKNNKLGILFNEDLLQNYKITSKMSFTEAIPAAIKESWALLVYNVKSFKLILRPATGAYKQVKSPVGIARALPDTWDWEYIWNFTALFSIGLAFMNLLPIPGLDGGHALFTIVEMITGKTLSDKAAGYVQTAGMIILLTLMALTFGKDIFQLVADKFF